MKPRSEWPVVATRDTFTLYEIDDHVLVVWPAEGCRDDAETATESIRCQEAHWHAQGRSGGAIVMMDPIQEQTNDARKVYQSLPDPRLITSFALVGNTTFGRAVTSVFLGILRPQVPTKAFAELDPAIEWVKERSLS